MKLKRSNFGRSALGTFLHVTTIMSRFAFTEPCNCIAQASCSYADASVATEQETADPGSVDDQCCEINDFNDFNESADRNNRKPYFLRTDLRLMVEVNSKNLARTIHRTRRYPA